MKELKPVGGLAKATVVMLCIYLFTMACHGLTSIYEVIELAFLDGDAYLEELLISQALTALIGVAVLFVYLVTAIVFLKWAYRVSANLHVKAGGKWDHSPSATIGWYFVPIAALFKPYQVMREIWSKAHQKKWGGETRLLGGWWALWIVSSIFGQIIWRINGETVQEFQGIAAVQIISDLIDIALGFTAIALVSNITRGYEQHFEHAAEDESGTEAASDYQKNLQTLQEPSV